MYVDDKFSKPFKSKLNKDVVYNFIRSMIEESKCCNDVIKNSFIKNLRWLKRVLWTLLNVGSMIMVILIMVLSKDHYYITEKHRSSAHRDCHLNIKINHKICVLFCNLKNYDSDLIM